MYFAFLSLTCIFVVLFFLNKKSVTRPGSNFKAPNHKKTGIRSFPDTGHLELQKP